MQNHANICCAASRPRAATGHLKETGVMDSKGFNKGIRFKDKMVRIDGGTFLMGTEDNEGIQSDCEGPIIEQKVKPFLMDSHAVTNEEFTQFIKETGYRTEAEKFGWSFVFYQFISPEIKVEVQQVAATPWWFAVEQAYWFQPEGPQSMIEGKMDHPVVHVSWNDAQAFAHWAGKRLPTEKEWEFAARGGLEQKKYPWGDELTPNGEHYCNIWQGKFPNSNTKEDGYIGTAPAISYPENGFGLYNMAGNVWEWCVDSFTGIVSPDLQEMDGHHIHRAMRGGSYLCHASYCNRYRVAARTSNTMDSSAGNIGFRCVAEITKGELPCWKS